MNVQFLPRTWQIAWLVLALCALMPPAGRAAPLYEPGQPAMLWTDSSKVQQALALLRGATAHGLEPWSRRPRRI